MRIVCDTGGFMLDINRDIHPLTDFKRNTPEFLAQLRKTGEPVVLTINGKAELVVQDARSYQKLRELAQRLETIEAVRESLGSLKRGEGRLMSEVFDKLEAELRAKSRK
jgi:prevent-host-death family protein